MQKYVRAEIACLQPTMLAPCNAAHCKLLLGRKFQRMLPKSINGTGVGAAAHQCVNMWYTWTFRKNYGLESNGCCILSLSLERLQNLA